MNKFFIKVHSRMGNEKRFLKTFRPQAKHSVQLLARGEMKSTEKFSKNKKNLERFTNLRVILAQGPC